MAKQIKPFSSAKPEFDDSLKAFHQAATELYSACSSLIAVVESSQGSDKTLRAVNGCTNLLPPYLEKFKRAWIGD